MRAAAGEDHEGREYRFSIIVEHCDRVANLGQKVRDAVGDAEGVEIADEGDGVLGGVTVDDVEDIDGEVYGAIDIAFHGHLRLATPVPTRRAEGGGEENRSLAPGGGEPEDEASEISRWSSLGLSGLMDRFEVRVDGFGRPSVKTVELVVFLARTAEGSWEFSTRRVYWTRHAGTDRVEFAEILDALDARLGTAGVVTERDGRSIRLLGATQHWFPFGIRLDVRNGSYGSGWSGHWHVHVPSVGVRRPRCGFLGIPGTVLLPSACRGAPRTLSVGEEVVAFQEDSCVDYGAVLAGSDDICLPLAEDATVIKTAELEASEGPVREPASTGTGIPPLPVSSEVRAFEDEPLPQPGVVSEQDSPFDVSVVPSDGTRRKIPKFP